LTLLLSCAGRSGVGFVVLCPDWVARSRSALATPRTPWTGPSSFRHTRWGAHPLPQMTKSPTHPMRTQPLPRPGTLLPRATKIGGEPPHQAQLRVSSDNQPRPPLRLLGKTQTGRGPTQLGLDQAESVLHVEAAQVAAPAHIQVRRLRSAVPQPHRPVRGTPVGQMLHAHLDNGALDDRQPGELVGEVLGEIALPMHLLVHAVPSAYFHPAVALT